MVFTLKNNFARGVLTKKAQSRVDLELYGAGVSEIKNWIVVPHGGLRRRSGTRYTGDTKTHSTVSRLIPFIFSTSQSYVCEFGDEYVRFWSPDGGQIVSGDPALPVEVATPYTDQEIWNVQFYQSGDVLYLVHPDFAPRKLTRTSATSWTLAEVAFLDGPYYPLNDTTTTVSTSGVMTVNTSLTVTFSAVAGINNGAGFTTADVGRHIRIRTNKWAWLQITAVTNTTTVTATVKRIGAGEAGSTSANQASANNTWRLGLFGTTPGFPGSISLFDGRLCYGRTDDKPRAVACSRAGLPDDFAPSNEDSTVAADHAIVLDIQQGRADEILWLYEGARLLIGTGQGVRSVGASDTSEGLTPTNVRQQLEINYGVAGVLPNAAGSNIFVAGRFGRSIRDLFYDFSVNAMVGPNISMLSDNLLKSGIVEMQYAQEPESIMWVLTADGKVVGVTYNRSEKIIGFHQHDFGGVVESICVVPGEDRDELWLLVQREIDGTTKRYIEVLEADFDEDGTLTAQEDAFFVDSGLTYSGTATNSIGGLDHLIGETVTILSSGAVLPSVVVDEAGEITLPNNLTTTKAHIGLPIQSRCVLLRPPIQQDDGPILMRRQRGVKTIVEVMNSLGVKVGTPNSSAVLLSGLMRRPSDPMNQAVALRSGAFSHKLDDSWEDGGQVVLQVDDPLPAYIRAVQLLVDVEKNV